MNGAPKWNVGEGRSCIKYCASDGVYFEKYDADGRLVLVSNERSDFEELKAFDERREVLLKEEREVWAKAKGITYEDAMSRSNEWQNVGLRGSLRARRLRRQQEAAAAAAKQREEHAAKDAERQACAEQEKRQRKAERAEQRQQLLEIQEELKRVREAKTAANAEGRE